MELYYHPLSPPARAVFALLKQLNIPFSEKLPDILGGELKKPEFLKLNPSHTIPILVDDGFALFESRAILAYVADKAGSALYPKELQKRAKVDCVLFYEASSLWPPIYEIRVARYFRQQEATAEQVKTIVERLEVVEKMMDGHKYLAGDTLTIADISVASSVGLYSSASWVPVAIKQWYDRVLAEVPVLKQMLDAEPADMEKLAQTAADSDFAQQFKK